MYRDLRGGSGATETDGGRIDVVDGRRVLAFRGEVEGAGVVPRFGIAVVEVRRAQGQNAARGGRHLEYGVVPLTGLQSEHVVDVAGQAVQVGKGALESRYWCAVRVNLGAKVFRKPALVAYRNHSVIVFVHCGRYTILKRCIPETAHGKPELRNIAAT